MVFKPFVTFLKFKVIKLLILPNTIPLGSKYPSLSKLPFYIKK